MQQPPYPPQQPPMMNQYQQWQLQAQFAKSYTTPAVITLLQSISMYEFLAGTRERVIRSTS
jgi:hypothetical protein